MLRVQKSSWNNGWPSQTWPPKVAVVVPAVAVAAVAAVAGLANLAATILMGHLCGIKQLFQYFFLFFFLYLFSKSNFPHVRALPEQVQQQQRPNFFYYYFSLGFFFAWRFLLRPWGICSFCFSSQNVHIFQVMLSNFIKNPFCYFSISSFISKSPISPIICMNVHESMESNFFFVWNSQKSLVFSSKFLWDPPFGGSDFAGPPVTKRWLISAHHFPPIIA